MVACGASSRLIAAITIPLIAITRRMNLALLGSASRLRPDTPANKNRWFEIFLDLNGANSRRGFDGFQFQWRVLVTNGCALENVSLKKWKNPAKPLILRGVHELVGDQLAVPPMIRPNEDSVIQRQTTRRRGEKIN